MKTEKGDGFRAISPPEKDQGMNDDDLEALIPLSSKILSLDLTYAEITYNNKKNNKEQRSRI